MAMPGKRRRGAALALAIFVAGMLMLLVACGVTSSNPPYNGTPKGTYTVTVRGTSGNVTQSTTFSLTVN